MLCLGLCYPLICNFCLIYKQITLFSFTQNFQSLPIQYIKIEIDSTEVETYVVYSYLREELMNVENLKTFFIFQILIIHCIYFICSSVYINY